MRRTERKNPVEGRRPGSKGSCTAGDNPDSNLITKAAIDKLIEDGRYILSACHSVAAGHGLHWSEYEALHDCFQTWFKVLEVVNRE